MKFTYNCKLKTVKKLYPLLKEIGLLKMITGECIENIEEVFDILLTTDKVNEFFKIITEKDIDFEDEDFSDLMETMINFFLDIMKSLKNVSKTNE